MFKPNGIEPYPDVLNTHPTCMLPVLNLPQTLLFGLFGPDKVEDFDLKHENINKS